ncbi:APC family permease [Luteimonas lutimaris]|uniref:Arginine/agmatine antiporter n=1 Tax=Luteimonas lutimaris TaxID=698645 RepID=A0ABP7M7K1_9GAMM
MPDPQQPLAPSVDSQPEMRRAVGRWQLYGLSINDVIGSGIYLLPAAAALLLGPASLWAVLLAGLAVSLLVLCYAQAASYFDQPGGGYLYAREAFGSFIGFEVGWMLLITRVASAAALSVGLAQAVTHFWPHAASGGAQVAIVTGSLAFLVVVNVVGVRAAARTGVFLAIAKVLPLLMFIAIGAMYVDMSQATSLPGPVPLRDLGEAALLLLFAYAGFENLPAAAGEYRNPQRDVPFAMLLMIATVTLLYFVVQWVALGTLPGLAQSQTPLADAAVTFGGGWLALALTVGAAVSILGTNSNTVMLGPRYLHAMAMDGYGPAALAKIHPRFRTPALAIITVGVLSLLLALTSSFEEWSLAMQPGWGKSLLLKMSSSFEGLALLSVVARLCTYIGTSVSVLVLSRRHGDRDGALRLPGGPLIPVAATLLSIGLLASATAWNLVAGAIALVLGAVVFAFRRKPAPQA